MNSVLLKEKQVSCKELPRK